MGVYGTPDPGMTVSEFAHKLLADDTIVPDALLMVRDLDTGKLFSPKKVQIEFHDMGRPTLWLDVEEH